MMQGYQIIALMWAGIALTLILVVTRLYVRIYLRSGMFKQNIWKWSEFFVVFAWLIFLFQGICMTILNNLHFLKFDDPEFQQTDEERMTSYKINWISNAVYMLCMYSVKAAMLCFYGEVVARTTLKLTKLSIWVIASCLVIGAIVTVCLLLFGCHPISTNWTLDDATACAPVWNMKINITIITFHLATDLMVWTFPFFLLRLVHGISRKEKASAAAMFALGTICMLCAAFVQATNWWEGVSGRIATLLGFTVEMTTAVAVACAPAFKVFIRGSKTKTAPPSSTYSSSKRTIDSVKGAFGEREKSSLDKSPSAIDTVVEI